MKNYSIVLPTCRRPQFFEDHLEWLLHLSPPPNEVLVVHPQSEEWTDQYNFDLAKEHSNVKLEIMEEDRGLFESKYTMAFEHLDDDFIFTCDSDIWPGKNYPENVFSCYQKKPGLYGGIGFMYGRNHFEGYVVGGSYQDRFERAYRKSDDIVEVDAIGQSFFWHKEDVGGYMSMEDLPDWACRFCSDDLYLSHLARQREGTKCFVVPHPKEKDQTVPVYYLREGDIETQSLVGGKHSDSEHKNQFITYCKHQNNYIRMLER